VANDIISQRIPIGRALAVSYLSGRRLSGPADEICVSRGAGAAAAASIDFAGSGSASLRFSCRLFRRTSARRHRDSAEASEPGRAVSFVAEDSEGDRLPIVTVQGRSARARAHRHKGKGSFIRFD